MKWLEIEKNKSSNHLHDHHDHYHKHDVNRHGDDIETFAMVTSQPVSMTSVNFFLELLMSQMGENILRIKGILNKRPDKSHINHTQYTQITLCGFIVFNF